MITPVIKIVFSNKKGAIMKKEYITDYVWTKILKTKIMFL